MPNKIKIYYSDFATFQLPENHNFPAEKYRLLRESLLSKSIFTKEQLLPAKTASKESILLAHETEYYDQLVNGTINPKIISKIGLPWSKELIRRALTSVGGTIASAKEALINNISGNLGGGTHHAAPASGQGFCIFNDVAVAIRYLLYKQMGNKFAVIDLDAHQGNGTAAILGMDQEVLTFSMHGAKTFPHQKVASTIDIGLPDYATDEDYLALLSQALPGIFAFNPSLIFYIAGADPLKGDRFGKLSLSKEGLFQRDLMVLENCKDNNIPVTIVLGGGYSKPIEKTVEIHAQTFEIAKKVFR